MTRTSLMALAAVTVLVVIAAIIAVTNRSAETAPDTANTGPLVPGLTERLNQVTALVITAGDHSVTISRPDPDSPHWTVAEKAGYPASPDAVRRTLLGLSEARTLEPRTAIPDKYAKLAVDEAHATRITLHTADNQASGQALPVVLIGKPAQGDSFYARRAGEAQSWLAEGHLPTPSTTPLSWLDRELPGLARSRVMSVTITRTGTPALIVSRKDAGQTDFAVTGLPAGALTGAKIKQSAANELAGAIEILSFEDVAKAEVESKPAPDVVTARFATFDGEVLTFRTQHRDKQSWVSLTASFEAPKTDGKPDEIQRTVQEIQSRYSGWRYRLPETAVKDLTRTAETLIEAPVSVPGKP